MSRSFGERLPAKPGERPCKHCAKGLSDHFLAMSEKRCYFPRNSTRYEPDQDAVDFGELDLEELNALDQLFAQLLRGGDAGQMLRRASIVSAMRKLHVMQERAKHTGGKQS